MKFLIALILTATSAGATCMPSVVLLEKLNKYGEYIESTAIDSKGRQITIWAQQINGQLDRCHVGERHKLHSVPWQPIQGGGRGGLGVTAPLLWCMVWGSAAVAEWSKAYRRIALHS